LSAQREKIIPSFRVVHDFVSSLPPLQPKLSSQYEEEERGTPEEKAGPKSSNKTHDEDNLEQVQARDEATFSCYSGDGGGQRRWWNGTASGGFYL